MKQASHHKYLLLRNIIFITTRLKLIFEQNLTKDEFNKSTQ